MLDADNPVSMSEAKTRPISFRVDVEVLDALEAMGKSPTEISRRALEREAGIVRRLGALRRAQEAGKGLRLPKDAVSLVRELRDGR